MVLSFCLAPALPSPKPFDLPGQVSPGSDTAPIDREAEDLLLSLVPLELSSPPPSTADFSGDTSLSLAA